MATFQLIRAFLPFVLVGSILPLIQPSHAFPLTNGCPSGRLPRSDELRISVVDALVPAGKAGAVTSALHAVGSIPDLTAAEKFKPARTCTWRVCLPEVGFALAIPFRHTECSYWFFQVGTPAAPDFILSWPLSLGKRWLLNDNFYIGGGVMVEPFSCTAAHGVSVQWCWPCAGVSFDLGYKCFRGELQLARSDEGYLPIAPSGSAGFIVREGVCSVLWAWHGTLDADFTSRKYFYIPRIRIKLFKWVNLEIGSPGGFRVTIGSRKKGEFCSSAKEHFEANPLVEHCHQAPPNSAERWLGD